MRLFFFMGSTLTYPIKKINFSLYLSITSLHLLYLCLRCVTFPLRGNDFYTWFSILVVFIILRILCLLHRNCRVPYRVFVVPHTLITSCVCVRCGCVSEYSCVRVGTFTNWIFVRQCCCGIRCAWVGIPQCDLGEVLAGTLGIIT